MSITPIQDTYPTFNQRLSNAVHVLRTEATALSCLRRLYETDPVAREGFNSAVEAITRFNRDKGKLVTSEIGKSGYIAKKLVATMNSLKIHVIYLYFTDALHGDLDKVGKHDTILLITFLGKISGLLFFLSYLDQLLFLIVITSHTHASTYKIIKYRPDAILLPAPIHKSETDSFGYSAPTISTTMALVLSDALVIVIYNELYVNVSVVFSYNHPGGALGNAFKGYQKVSDLAIPFTHIPEVRRDSVTGAHILMTGYRSETGWVRLGGDIVVPPRRIKRLRPFDMDEPAMCIEGPMVPSEEWISIPAETDLPQATGWITRMRGTVPGAEIKYGDDAVLVTIVEGEVSGVIEIAELMA